MEVVNDMLVFEDQAIKKWWAIPLDYFFGANEKEGKLVVSFFIADNGSYAEAVVDKETYGFVDKTMEATKNGRDN